MSAVTCSAAGSRPRFSPAFTIGVDVVLPHVRADVVRLQVALHLPGRVRAVVPEVAERVAALVDDMRGLDARRGGEGALDCFGDLREPLARDRRVHLIADAGDGRRRAHGEASALKYGACSERLIVKIPPTASQFQVPWPWLLLGSLSGPGQPSGPSGWLHDIAASRPVFVASVVNGTLSAASVVSVIGRAWVSALEIAFVMNVPCFSTSE